MTWDRPQTNWKRKSIGSWRWCRNAVLGELAGSAYQALAIDDERLTFHPIIWEKDVEDYQEMKQVWFTGMHTDVGGGYKEQELSDVPLVWMTDMAVKKGLRIYPKHTVKINDENSNGHMHDSRGGRWSKFYRRRIRSWDVARYGEPVVHESVAQRTKNCQNDDTPQYEPWIRKLNPKTEPWVLYKDTPSKGYPDDLTS